MFENIQVQGYTYASRFIASWVREGGKLNDYDGSYSLFEEWLRSLGIDESEVRQIMFLSKNGKRELEDSAKEFLESHQNA